VARLRREAHTTARLAHRGIVRVFDLVEVPDAGSLAMVMERLRGRTLSERLRCEGPLSVETTLRTLVPLLSALHYVHGLGIIHRDLKPENVFLHLEPDGEVVPKLLDFGVSKVLRSSAAPITLVGWVVGTPTYMSPEQRQGGEVDARSDVFGAGVLLHTCLTGHGPFDCDEAGAVSSREIGRERPRGIPTALWSTVLKALEASPERRYSSAAELRAALARTAPGWVVPSRAAERGAFGVVLASCIAGLSGMSLGAAPTDTSSHPPRATSVRAAAAAQHAVAPVDVLRVAPALPRGSHAHRDPYVWRDPGF
jgi:serine/threonine-protein kinase